MAINCEFDASLNDALRDQFVRTALRSYAQAMLTEDSLTFKRAVEILLETAAKNVKSFQESDSLVVKQIASSVPRPHHSHRKKNLDLLQRSQPPCKHCGKSNHSESICHFKFANCHTCGKKGHLAPICGSTNNSKAEVPSKKKYHRSLAEHFVSPNPEGKLKNLNHPYILTIK